MEEVRRIQISGFTLQLNQELKAASIYFFATWGQKNKLVTQHIMCRAAESHETSLFVTMRDTFIVDI